MEKAIMLALGMPECDRAAVHIEADGSGYVLLTECRADFNAGSLARLASLLGTDWITVKADEGRVWVEWIANAIPMHATMWPTQPSQWEAVADRLAVVN